MSSFVHISEATSLAIHALLCLASVSHGARATAPSMAETLGVSEAHLAKVLQRLSREGMVRARRGPGGGFVLGKANHEITLLQIFEAIEGPLTPTGCLLGRPRCLGHRCCLGPLLGKVEGEVRHYLSTTRLSDLVDSPLIEATPSGDAPTPSNTNQGEV
jgi:Rrf2 family protein